MKELDLTKEYICDSCGAPLEIDEEHQVLICKYCGVTHDYAYFLQDDSLFVGYSFLEAGNFKSALRSFAFILKRDPHNVLALRGMLFANFKIKRYSELNTSNLMMTPAKEKALADCIKNAPELHRRYFERIKENIDLRKKIGELRMMVSELQKRDTTHTEYDYDTTIEETTVISNVTFREALYSVFFESRGGLSNSAMLIGFVDFVGIAGLIATAASEKSYQQNIQHYSRTTKVMVDKGVGAGTVASWIVIIMLAVTIGIPLIKSIFGVTTRKKVEKKVLKTARVVVDTEVRDKLDECRAEIRKSNERIKEIDRVLRVMDHDFKARQGY